VFYSGEQEDANNIRSAGSFQVTDPLPGNPGIPDLVPNTYIITPTVTTAETPLIFGGTGNLGGDLNVDTRIDPQRLKMSVVVETSPQQIQNLGQAEYPQQTFQYLPGPFPNNPLPTWWPTQTWNPVTSAGSYNVRTTVNTATGNQHITEQNGSNNLADQTLNVIVPSTPDLAPATFDLSSVGSQPGSTVNLTTDISNIGSGGSAQTFRAGFYLSEDQTITIGDQLIDQCNSLSVPNPGQSVTCDRTATIPQSASPGNRFLGVLIDDVGGGFGQVAEALETNNGASDAFRVDGLPSVTSVSPVAGTGAAVSLTAAYSDPDGGNDIALAFLLLNSSLNENNGCKVAYDQTTGQLRLYNDLGTAVEGSIAVNSGASIENSQCKLRAPFSGDPPAVIGNDLTVVFDLEFKASFAGSKRVYLRADDILEATSGWIEKGSWTATAPGPDQSPSVGISSPTGGSSWQISKVPISWTANDDIGVENCQLTMDGVVIPFPICGNGSLTSTEISYVHLPDTSKRLALDFAEGDGVLAYDRSGNNNNAELRDGAIWTASGQYGQALNFDGVNDYVHVPDSPELRVSAAATWLAWVKPNTLDNETVINKNELCGDPDFIIQLAGPGSTNGLSLWDGTAWRNSTDNVLTTGAWQP
jgi:hypothetical protein